MNNRERFEKTMRFEPVDHPPIILDVPWPRTIERWRREGGYIPRLDHTVAPDISWENYKHYVATLKELYGL